MVEFLIKYLTPVIRNLLGALLFLSGPLAGFFGRGLPTGRGEMAPDQLALARILLALGADSVEGIPVELQRTQTDDLADLAGVSVDSRGLASIETTVAGATGELRARLYRPDPVTARQPMALLVWFHGGGWTVGSIESHDPPLRLLARLSGTAILSVEYRLAPEHPFPAAVDDVVAAWRDIKGRRQEFVPGDGSVMVGGDSAGGNLAAVLCLALREAGEPQPDRQVLVYPAVDLAGETASYDRFGEGLFLSREKIDFYKDTYIPDLEDRQDWQASPIRAHDLSGLAPACVWTAAADPLADEGREYADRLAAAGVPVRFESVPGFHGWMNITISRTSRRGLASLAGAIAPDAA